MRSTIHALETSPGTLLRINPDSTQAHFAQATNKRNVLLSCAHLISIIAIKKGADKLPLELMGSEVEQSLMQRIESVGKSLESNKLHCNLKQHFICLNN